MKTKLWTIGVTSGFLAFLAWIAVAATLGFSEPIVIVFVLLLFTSITAFVLLMVLAFAQHRERG